MPGATPGEAIAQRQRLRDAWWRFGLLGAISLVVNLAVVGALRELAGCTAAVAGALGYAVVLVMNFVLARRHVFKSAAALGPELLRFGLVQFGTRLAEYATYLLLVYRAGLAYAPAIVVVAAVFFVVKFGLYRGYVFGPRRHLRGRDET